MFSLRSINLRSSWRTDLIVQSLLHLARMGTTLTSTWPLLDTQFMLILFTNLTVGGWSGQLLPHSEIQPQLSSLTSAIIIFTYLQGIHPVLESCPRRSYDHSCPTSQVDIVLVFQSPTVHKNVGQTYYYVTNSNIHRPDCSIPNSLLTSLQLLEKPKASWHHLNKQSHSMISYQIPTNSHLSRLLPRWMPFYPEIREFL